MLFGGWWLDHGQRNLSIRIPNVTEILYTIWTHCHLVTTTVLPYGAKIYGIKFVDSKKQVNTHYVQVIKNHTQIKLH